jgi:hypothetical protein
MNTMDPEALTNRELLVLYGRVLDTLRARCATPASTSTIWRVFYSTPISR